MRTAGIALAALGLLSAVTAVAPAPAQACDWNHRGWDHHWRGSHDNHNSGAAIGFGILGGILAGAAIASTQTYAPPPPYYAPSYYGYAGYGYYGYYR